MKILVQTERLVDKIIRADAKLLKISSNLQHKSKVGWYKLIEIYEWEDDQPVFLGEKGMRTLLRKEIKVTIKREGFRSHRYQVSIKSSMYRSGSSIDLGYKFFESFFLSHDETDRTKLEEQIRLAMMWAIKTHPNQAKAS